MLMLSLLHYTHKPPRTPRHTCTHVQTQSMSKGLCGGKYVWSHHAWSSNHDQAFRELSMPAFFFPALYILITQFSHNALQLYRFISESRFRWLQRQTTVDDTKCSFASFLLLKEMCLDFFPSRLYFFSTLTLNNVGDNSKCTLWLNVCLYFSVYSYTRPS